MRSAAAVAVLALLVAGPALAEEPSGCDKFAWDITGPQALLAAPAETAGAAAFDRGKAVAISVPLSPLGEAKLAMPPERAPKNSDSYAGSVPFAAGGDGTATYRVSLSANAWIDVVQDGGYVKSGRFTGARDCTGIRKSVEFAIGPGPFIVQLSGADSPEIRMVLTPAD
jgi:hypothetical protein